LSEVLAVDDPLSDDAREALALASLEAQRLHHESIRTEHILLGLVQQDGVAASILEDLDLNLCQVRAQVEAMVQPGTERGTTGQPSRSRLAKAVIKAAGEEARNLALATVAPGHRVLSCDVGPEHLLLGLLGEPDGVAAKVLMSLGLTREGLREEMRHWFSVPRQEEQILAEAELQSLPAETRRVLEELGLQIEQLIRAREALIAQQDFEQAAQLVAQARRLNRRQRAILREHRSGAG
jgi:ATP-dependent Clp protease ATP-binding subunit ClpC